MKKISIVIPTYNEELNIKPITDRLVNMFDELAKYNYEIIFVDNCSTDSTRSRIEECNAQNNKVKGIFYTKNFGFNNSCFYGLMQGTGDCTVLIFADMQDPPEVIKEFIENWEKGYKIVVGIKNKSKENFILYFLRTIYYKLVKKIAEIDHIEHFTGFGLYDKSFIETLKSLEDSQPYLRGIVAEFGGNIKKVVYKQDIRRYGKTKFNFYRMYDTAMLGITSYSKVVMRLATMVGFVMSIICFALGIWTIVLKLLNWNTFQIGFAGLSVGMFFMGSVVLFFIGFLGEYILSINARVLKRPLVIEEKRVGFD